MIRIGIIGCGFIGRMHLAAFSAWPDGLVTAIADADAEALEGVDPGITRYHAADQLIDDDRIDLVVVATHTDTHVAVALRALAAGRHVLVEKPVALAVGDVLPLRDAASLADPPRLCAPAMCIRHWPQWSWLRDRITTRDLGGLRSLAIERLGAEPAWGAGFYADRARSGGAITDLHIHDTDFICWSLGMPAAVTTAGDVDQGMTLYHFDGGPKHVTAAYAWVPIPTFAFRMAYRAVFDRAVAEHDSARGTHITITAEGGIRTEDPGPRTGYDVQVRHILDVLAAGRTVTTATMDDAVATARVIDAERASMDGDAPLRVEIAR